MISERFAMLMLPIFVLYGLMFLRVLARFFVRAFVSREDEPDSRLFRSYTLITPPATELALASIVLDLSHIAGIWPSLTRIGGAMEGSSVALVLPIVLLVLHCQLYIVSSLIERRLLLSKPDSPRRPSMIVMNLIFGVISVFTNAVTVNALLALRGF